MENYQTEIKTYVTKMSDERYRVEFFHHDAEYLSLYYERAKKGFVSKPVGLNTWVCVEAKYSDGDIYKLFPDLTPRQLIDWGQKLVTLSFTDEQHGPQDNEG